MPLEKSSDKSLDLKSGQKSSPTKRGSKESNTSVSLSFSDLESHDDSELFKKLRMSPKELLEKRRKLMEAWGAFCEAGSEKVLPFRQATQA